MSPEKVPSGAGEVERPTRQKLVNRVQRADVVDVFAALELIEADLVERDLRPLAFARPSSSRSIRKDEPGDFRSSMNM
jgi:hypothetical protein